MATRSYRGLVHRGLYGEDGKVRATYRVVLAFVAFFVSGQAGLIVAGVVGLPFSLPGVMVVTVVNMLVMAVLFYVVWVQRLDKRSLADYGIDLSSSDITWFAVAFVATLTGIGIWFLFWITTGWMSVDVVLSYENGSLTLAVLLGFVLITAGAILQDLAFLGLIFNNAIAGVRSRVDDATAAVAGGLAVTAAFFLAFHFLLGAGAAGFLPPLQAALFLVVGLAYFVAVYIYTGSLTAAMGAHAATNFRGLLYGWKALEPSLPFAIPKVLVIAGLTPLTGIVGPIPVTGLLLGFVLLAVSTRTPVLDSNASPSALQE